MFADRTNWNLAPNRLSEALARHRAAGKPLIDLTVSNPTHCGFEYDGDAILEALHNPASLTYEPNPKGLEVARRAVASYYASHGVEVLIDDILLTTSTSEAYSFVFRTLCNPGDELLFPEPSYPLFSFLAEIQDVKLVRYPLIYDHGWQMDFHSLEQAITPRTRGVIVVNPNNPTGNYCKPAELASLNEISSSRNLAIIADEVFLDFSLNSGPLDSGPLNSGPLNAEHPASFAANRGAPTFTMSGISKICGLPQMKAAWLVVNGPEHMKTQALARLEVIADTYLSMNAPVQAALPQFLLQRDGFQSQLLARVRANLLELDRQLAEYPGCARLALEGGWYAVMRVPAVRSDEDLALELLEIQNVLVHPGHFYDFPSKGYLVLSLIIQQSEFREGLRQLLSVC